MTKIDTIPASVMSIAVKLLQEYIPELTADGLRTAISQHYNDDGQSPPIQKGLTRQECANILGVSITTINRYIKNRKLEAVNISPRLVRINPNSIHELLNRGIPQEEVLTPPCLGKRRINR